MSDLFFKKVSGNMKTFNITQLINNIISKKLLRILMKNYLYVCFIAMLPLIELRGAIPVAHALHVSQANFQLFVAYLLIIIGNLLPVTLIYFFAQKTLQWGQNKPVIGSLCSFFLEKGESAGKKLQAKTGNGLFWALVLFVGIPLPGTGAWTGTLAASLLKMDFKLTLWAVTLGVVLAAIIIGVLCAVGFGAWFGVVAT